MAAVVAIPFEGVEMALRPLGLDHQAVGARLRPLGRMAGVGRQQQHVALADRHVPDPAVLDDAQGHVALDLVEELLQRVVVEVRALVRPGDDGDDEVGVLPDLGVADRRPEHLVMVGDPLHEIEGGESGHGPAPLGGVPPGRFPPAGRRFQHNVRPPESPVRYRALRYVPAGGRDYSG